MVEATKTREHADRYTPREIEHLQSKHLKLDKQDIDQQPELEKEDGELSNRSSISSSEPVTSQGVPLKTISFADGDPENPNNWPQGRKTYVIIVAIVTVANSAIGSSLATGVAKHYLTTSTSQTKLGYCVVLILWGPLSESYGRRTVMLIAFFAITIWTMACALAPNFAAFNVFRLLVGIFGSCPISVVGGICADAYHNPAHRGRAMALFMGATVFGPLLGPIISGFIGVVSWHWIFWPGLIIAGATWIPLYFMPEEYAPIILKKLASLKSSSLCSLANLDVLLRSHRPLLLPLHRLRVRHLLHLPQSYPVISQGIYGFNAGEEGFTFLPTGTGAIFTVAIYLTWDSILRRTYAREAPWVRREESRQLPLAFIARPFIVIALFLVWLDCHGRISTGSFRL